MEEIFSSETSVYFQQTTRRYIPEDITLRPLSYLTNRKNIKYEIKITHMPFASEQGTREDSGMKNSCIDQWLTFIC
jgi:hypothetical protein